MSALLVVGEGPDFASSVATICKALGQEVTPISSPREALDHLAARRPDALLLDVMFPEDPTAGLELAREVRRNGPCFFSGGVCALGPCRNRADGLSGVS